MQVVLAKRARVLKRTYIHPSWGLEEGTWNHVNHLFKVNCCKNGISSEKGLLDINVMVTFDHNSQPKSSMVIDDAEGVIANILNNSGTSPDDICTQINLSVQIATDEKILLDFDDCKLGRFERLNFLSGSLYDLSFNTSLLKNCTWESVWWLMAFGNEDFRISVQLEISKDLIGAMNVSKLEAASQDHALKLGDAYTDICVQTLEGLSIACHKSVLTGQSEVFDRELNGGFKEMTDASLQMAFSFHAVDNFLHFLYTGNFKPPNQDFKDDSVLELLQAAHYYHIPGLWDKIYANILGQVEWDAFTVEGCLEIFQFLILVEDEKKIEQLAKKLVQVVSKKVDLPGITGIKSLTMLVNFLESNKQNLLEAWTRFTQMVLNENFS